MDVLTGLRVAILVEDGFERVELREPRSALDRAGAVTRVVSSKCGTVRGWNLTDWGEEIAVDEQLNDALLYRFDALLLPGGVINIDSLRIQPRAVAFVRTFVDEDKPIAVIGHAPWMIIEADGAPGRRITSWPSLQLDVWNAGAEWANEPAVIDSNLVSGRSPEDIPAFNDAMLAVFGTACSRLLAA